MATTAYQSSYTGAQIDAAIGAVPNKQDTLVSGTNIKTINNQSLLGSGNISIPGGSSVSIIPMKARWSGGTLGNFTFDEPATAFDTINGIQSPSDLLNIFFVVETGTTHNNQFVSDEYYMIMRIVDNTDDSIYCSTYNFFEKYTLEIYIDEEQEVLSVTDVLVDSGSSSSSHILSSETNEYDPGRDLYYIDGTSASDSDAHDLLLENAWVIHDGAYYYLISSSTSSGTINYYLATFDKTNSRIAVKTIPWRTSQQDFYYTSYAYYPLGGGDNYIAMTATWDANDEYLENFAFADASAAYATYNANGANTVLGIETGTMDGNTFVSDDFYYYAQVDQENAGAQQYFFFEFWDVTTKYKVTIQVNQSTLSVNTYSHSDYLIDGSITVPTKTSDLNNDSGFISSESDPVFTASAAYGISSSDITNWNGKTSNVGTITGITMNNVSKGTSGVVDLGTVITSETSLSKGSTSGSGNAVTDLSVSGHTITLTKGKTFLESETQLSKGSTTGSGNAVTDISVSGHQITLTKGTTFLTSSDVVTIYSGSSAPSSGTGSNGDIYIQTT